MPMTFQQWLWRQRTREDPVGDLARDAAHDRQKPSGDTTRQWMRYLVRLNAAPGAIRACLRAWTEYLAEERRRCR
jgi:YozE SAM-like fold